MAISIHTDREFEKCLNWLTKKMGKAKTQIIKELVFDKYRSKKEGFRFGALKTAFPSASRKVQEELKEIDHDHDLD